MPIIFRIIIILVYDFENLEILLRATLNIKSYTENI